MTKSAIVEMPSGALVECKVLDGDFGCDTGGSEWTMRIVDSGANHAGVVCRSFVIPEPVPEIGEK